MLFTSPLTNSRELLVTASDTKDPLTHAHAITQRKNAFWWLFDALLLFISFEQPKAKGLDEPVWCESVFFHSFRNLTLGLTWPEEFGFSLALWVLKLSLPTEMSIHVQKAVWKLWKLFYTVILFLCYTMYNKTHAKDCNVVLFEGKKGILKKV